MRGGVLDIYSILYMLFCTRHPPILPYLTPWVDCYVDGSEFIMFLKKKRLSFWDNLLNKFIIQLT
jgi:hypothetical protein